MGDLPAGEHVFLCYAREDSTQVDNLDGLLREAGFPVWRDTADLWPGQDWRAVIRRAITDKALVFLACFSSRSLARPVGFQNAELMLAAEQARLRRTGDSWLIPVRLDECELPPLDLGGGRTLRDIQRADLFGENADDAAERLVTAIGQILGTPRGTAQAIPLAVDAALAADASGLSARMLGVLALLSEAGVPRGLLAMAAGAAEPAVDEVLARLAESSVVSLSADGATVLANRRMLRVLRERAIAAGTLGGAITDAVNALDAMLPAHQDAWRHPGVMGEFVAQITALAAHLAEIPGPIDAPAWEEAFLGLLSWAGWYLNELSDTARSVPLLEKVLADRERLLGLDHPDTLTSRNNLAFGYQSAGRLAEAISLFQQAFADRERLLGPDHPHTFTSRNNLAFAYQSAGRDGEAVPLYERSLAECERALGESHPLTRTIRGNYVSALDKARG